MKYFLSFFVLFSLTSSLVLADQQDVDLSNNASRVSQIQATDPTLPSGVSDQKGIFGSLMSTLFNADGTLKQIFMRNLFTGVTTGNIPTYSTVTRQFSNSILTTDGTNIGIGTATLGQKLDVTGTMRGGTTAAINGDTFVEGRYSGANIINTIGSQYSSAATTIGYGVRPKSGAAGSVSSAGNAAFSKGSLELTSELVFKNGATATVAVGTDVPMTQRFKVDVNGNVITSGDLMASRLCTSTGASCVNLPFSAASIDGGGTANYVARFTDADTLGIGALYDNGTNVGIGTTSPASKLTVVGGGIDVGNTTTGGSTINLYGSTPGAYSRLFTSNGNMHIDSGFGTFAANTLYLNYYSTGNISIGNSAGISNTTVLGDFVTGRRGSAGTYNSLQVQGVWSISDANRIDTTANNFGTQYGITYAHTNAGSGALGSKLPLPGEGHQLMFTENGVTRAGISLSTGDISTVGGLYVSDTVGIGIVRQPTVKLYAYQTTAGANSAIYGNTLGTGQGVLGQSTGGYGLYGRTLAAASAGVIGFNTDQTVYGTLGQGTRYAMYGSGDISVNGNVVTGREGTVGTYNPAQVQGIWSIGDSYKIDTVANNFGTQYGMVYAYTNAGSGALGGKLPLPGEGHQIMFTSAGVTTAGISMTTGDISTNGGLYVSDTVGIGVARQTAQKLYVQQTAGTSYSAVYAVTLGTGIGVYGQSTGGYGVYGRTLITGYAGVIGYNSDATSYGMLGYNGYSLYGNGQIYVAGNIQTAGSVKTTCVGNCF